MKNFLITPLLALSMSLVLATDIRFVNNKKIKIPLSQSASEAFKEITIPHIQLSTHAQHAIIAHLKSPMPSHLANNFSELPTSIKLGMQRTPVLDQGIHASSGTFAITAAIDALLGAGDYISQLCHLELGTYLLNHNKIPASGWNGSFGTDILSQISQYGVIPKNYQKTQGCAGVKSYNIANIRNEGTPMTDTEFSAHSIPLGSVFKWKSLIPSLDAHLSYEEKVWQTLFNTKQAIANGHRVGVGVMVFILADNIGADGQTHVAHDTWMLTSAIEKGLMNDSPLGAHEMVITGYDDSLIVKDAMGYMNQGAFILRNSWTSNAGDKGNYYLSYDYFRSFAFEVYEINLIDKKAIAKIQ